jgi:DNA-binding NarL/FixJ family response regulator
MAGGRSILVVDDHKIFRLGLVSTLRAIPGVETIIEAENGLMALDTIQKEKVDIVFMDIRMPVMNGIDATAAIKKLNSGVKVIALTMFDDNEYLSEMFTNGASGYLLKNTDADEIREAMETVLLDEKYFSREISESMLNALLNKQNAPRHGDGSFMISQREKQILLMVCDGLSNKEIAEKLQISSRTVEGHRARLLYKTQCKNTAELVNYANRNKLR